MNVIQHLLYRQIMKYAQSTNRHKNPPLQSQKQPAKQNINRLICQHAKQMISKMDKQNQRKLENEIMDKINKQMRRASVFCIPGIKKA